MTIYIVKRVLLALITLVLVSLIIFVAAEVLPVNIRSLTERRRSRLALVSSSTPPEIGGRWSNGRRVNGSPTLAHVGG